uniref:rolling circle replication-associated protein n=1 Tax=Spiroplasma endosymbiont of Polydrusus formosus TaxID=3139326 RepID=UPI004040A761
MMSLFLLMIKVFTCQHYDLSRFIKSLRKFFERNNIFNIKCLASSECGSRTNRPHYHLCVVFDLPWKNNGCLKIFS